MEDRMPVVELRNVSIAHTDYIMGRKSASARRMVLRDVSFDVCEGELVYLIGRVGSGKSTLLKALYGEIPLAEGEANVAGYDLTDLSRRDIPYLRRRMGIVFQDYQLLTDRNVFQNLLFVLKATGWKDTSLINQRIAVVLDMVGLRGKELKVPYELSGGEQQRLAIARALLNSPQIIVADEPTGNLDPSATNEIMNLLVKITKQNCAVIMSTHNISNIQRYPSRTLRFNNGKVDEIDVHSILGI